MSHFYTVNKFAWIVPFSFLLYPAVEIIKIYLSNYEILGYIVIFILIFSMSVVYAKAINVECFVEIFVKNENISGAIELIERFNYRCNSDIKYNFEPNGGFLKLRIIGNYYSVAYLRMSLKKLLK